MAALTMGALVGGLVGALLPLPAAGDAAISDGTLPVPPRAAMQRYSEADFAKLRDGALWGGSTTAQGSPATVSSWRLLGVVTGPVQAALVESSQKQFRVLSGQPLPDGSLLLRVNSGGIEFERGKCPFQRSLYSPVDVPIATSNCPASNNATPPNRSKPSE